MLADRPFQDLLKVTTESKKLIFFLTLITIMGCIFLFLGTYFGNSYLWLKDLGTTFFLAAIIGLIYELGMRKTILKEMEKIVQDNSIGQIEADKINNQINSLSHNINLLRVNGEFTNTFLRLGIEKIFFNREQLSLFIKEELENALEKTKFNEPLQIDLAGFGLTSFFDQIGSYYNLMLKLTNIFEESTQNTKFKMRVVFPHPENNSIIERANAQIKGRPTVEDLNPEVELSDYVNNLIKFDDIKGFSNYQQLINSMERKYRLYTDIFQLGAGFFKDRKIVGDHNPGITVRFTLLNPTFQYIRINNILVVEPYHFGVNSLTRSGECLSTPEKESIAIYYDLGRNATYPAVICNHFEYIWSHPKDTLPWDHVFKSS